MKKNISKNLFLFAWLTAAICQQAHAQVATTYSDTILASGSGAALAINNTNSISAGFKTENGDKDNQEIDGMEYKSAGPQAMLNLFMQTFAFQFYYQSLTHSETIGAYKTKKNQLHFMAGHKYSDYLSLGLEFKKSEINSEEAYLNSWQSETDSGFNSDSTHGSVSGAYQIISSVYLATRIGLVKNEHTKRVANKWLERDLAISYLSSSNRGESGIRLRSEISWYHSPRSKQQKAGDLMVNHHPETDRFTFALELMKAYSVITFIWEKQKERAPTQNTYDIYTSKLQLGYSDAIFISNLLGSIHLAKTKNFNEFYNKSSTIISTGISFVF